MVTPEGALTNDWVHVDGDAIASVGHDRPSVDAPVFDLEGAWLLPGLVDLHMHGGGGHSVADSQEAMVDAVAFHRRHGTTATLVSLMTAPVDELSEQLSWAASSSAAGPRPAGACSDPTWRARSSPPPAAGPRTRRTSSPRIARCWTA